jgi:small redox-active disulfide protein 2
MKTIKVLGTGCPKCQMLTTTLKNFVEQHQVKDVQIEKVEDIMKIMEYNVMTTPTLVINEIVTIKGRIPSEQELTELLLTDH